MKTFVSLFFLILIAIILTNCGARNNSSSNRFRVAEEIGDGVSVQARLIIDGKTGDLYLLNTDGGIVKIENKSLTPD